MAVGVKSADEEQFNLAILKKFDGNSEYNPVNTVYYCHMSEITQILALTDFQRNLSFVTLSLEY